MHVMCLRTSVLILKLPLQLRQQTPCQYDNSFLLCIYKVIYTFFGSEAAQLLAGLKQ